MLTRKFIKIGMVGDTYTQVLSGLSPGQSVVLADYAEAVPSSNTDSTDLGNALGGGGGGFGGFGGAGFFSGGVGGGGFRVERNTAAAGGGGGFGGIDYGVDRGPGPARSAQSRRHQRRRHPSLLRPSRHLVRRWRRSGLGRAARLGRARRRPPARCRPRQHVVRPAVERRLVRRSRRGPRVQGRPRDEVDTLVETLAGAGVPVQQPPYDAFWGARYAVVSDPDGNAVGIMSPVDPDRRSPA